MRSKATKVNLAIDLKFMEQQRQMAFSPPAASTSMSMRSSPKSHLHCSTHTKQKQSQMYTLKEKMKGNGQQGQPKTTRNKNENYYTMTSQTGHERATYNISDYRSICRTCKDMEAEAMNYISQTSRKVYKTGSLFREPNKPARQSQEDKLTKEQIVSKKPTRYNTIQLKKLSLDQLIKIILRLQEDNDALRAELEKLKPKHDRLLSNEAPARVQKDIEPCSKAEL